MPEEQLQQQVEKPEQNAVRAGDAGEIASDSATEEQQRNTEEEGEPDKPKREGGFQRRINKLTRDNTETRQERDYWRDQALRSDARPFEAQSSVQVEAEAGKPDPMQFSTQADYLEALTDWKVDKQTRKVEASRQQTAARDAFSGRESAFTEATPDYRETIAGAVADELPMSATLWAEVQGNEDGPALLYFLAKNPDQAERLSQMTPVEVAREVVRLEGRYKAAGQTPTRTVSNAPKPPNPVGRQSTQTGGKDPGEMTPGEYRKWRSAQHPGLDK